jgi:hypothetical protein
MHRLRAAIFSFLLVILPSGNTVSRPVNGSLSLSLSTDTAPGIPKLYETRQFASDLEVGGELADLPAGSTRYIRREQLLELPQVSYTVTDDTNFTGQTTIEGVELAELVSLLAAPAKSDLVVAICDDKYRANYPRAYLEIGRAHV